MNAKQSSFKLQQNDISSAVEPNYSNSDLKTQIKMKMKKKVRVSGGSGFQGGVNSHFAVFITNGLLFNFPHLFSIRGTE